MENSADRFFKGFSLEDFRLQVFVNRLEKEKKQCLNRLKEEAHVFKMSVRLPVKRGEEYWSQYGENFHANGDKREKASVTHLSAELNKEGPFTLTVYFFIIFSFLVASFLLTRERKLSFKPSHSLVLNLCIRRHDFLCRDPPLISLRVLVNRNLKNAIHRIYYHLMDVTCLVSFLVRMKEIFPHSSLTQSGHSITPFPFARPTGEKLNLLVATPT